MADNIVNSPDENIRAVLFLLRNNMFLPTRFPGIGYSLIISMQLFVVLKDTATSMFSNDRNYLICPRIKPAG